MSDVVVFPDATAIVTDYLRTELDERGAGSDPIAFTSPDTYDAPVAYSGGDAQVRSKVGNPRPTRFVRVQRVGGPRLNLVADNALLAVETWAPTSEEAHDLAQLCRGLVHAMRGTSQGGVAVYRVGEASGPQELPDPQSHHPRYSFTVSVALRGASLDAGS